MARPPAMAAIPAAPTTNIKHAPSNDSPAPRKLSTARMVTPVGRAIRHLQVEMDFNFQEAREHRMRGADYGEKLPRNGWQVKSDFGGATLRAQENQIAPRVIFRARRASRVRVQTKSFPRFRQSALQGS